MEELNNQETIKICVEEFSRLQEWMQLAQKDTAVYNSMKIRYRDLKVILTALGVNVTELDVIKESIMQIYVDADACPVVGIVEKTAQKYQIPVTLLCDTNHVLSSDYSEVVVVGAGADAVDYKLISLCHRGDIVVSQDYGVADMALGKGAYAIHQSGKWYTEENIDQMLMERHLNKKARRASHKNHLKGPKKRTAEDDERFAQSFERLIKAALEA